ncbi:multiple epidermal growth factor-like domains protein 6 [Mya arenaria]|uniref:multiple epidermal growth factor-like domains protein 6 n=1 Tax=Mya arenaria TaxID=6604 RepID=UPI0022DF424B|nr:multiple epidermal growth factor-like domains protein 6 [Mya arenaria]
MILQRVLLLCVCSYAALTERDERSVQIVINNNDGSGDSDSDCACEAVDVGEECCGFCEDSNAECRPFRCVDICQCRDGHVFCGCEAGEGSCQPEQGLNGACVCNAQCPLNSICNPSSGVCECASGFVEASGECIPDTETPPPVFGGDCDGDGGNLGAINCPEWPVFKCQRIPGTGPRPKKCLCNGPFGYVDDGTGTGCVCDIANKPNAQCTRL